MFHFTPLLGAHSLSGASQSLLEFEGGIRILVDVGWDSHFDVAQLKELERITPTLSLILLTHATSQHLAAFAHACKHFPLFRQVPIYATTPVISFGQTLLQDLYASNPAAAGVVPDDLLDEAAYLAAPTEDKPKILYQSPTIDEIRSYFALINDLKYSQPHQPLPSPFSPPLNGLTVTAYGAGHTPGGTIWHIQHGMESVVYASDWNLNRENILSGAAWLSGGPGGNAEVIEQLRKPTALVCSSKGVERNPQSRPRRDEQLLDMLRNGVERGGTVLVPSDSSARVLEIAYMVDKACAAETANAGLRKAKVLLAGKSMGNAIRYAKSMLEWMNESVVREFENREMQQSKQNQTMDKSPFDFRFVKVVEKEKRLRKVLAQTGPRIIIASDEALSWGYSRTVFEAIAEDSNSSVILTDEYSLRENSRDQSASLGQTLWRWHQERQGGVAVEKGSSGQQFEQAFTDGRDIVVHEPSMQPLEGNELAIYQSFLATQRQLQTTMQSSGATGLETSADVVDEEGSDSSSSTDESEDDQQGKALNFSHVLNQANKAKGAGTKDTLGINALLREPGFYDWDVRGKKGRESMFPFPQKRRRIDDYGDVIRPEDYLRAEERDEIDGQDMRNGEDNDQGLGQKRKWDESAGAQNANPAQQQSAKKRKTDNAYDSGYATSNGNASSDDSDSDDEYDPDDAGPALPSKLVWKERTVKANLRIGFVDFAGIHDQRSLTMLIPLINPRKLVLFGGTSSETTWLANECARKMNLQLPEVEGNDSADILLPNNGEVVVASMDTHAWTVTLSRALTRRLHWQNVRGLGVVTLTGRLEHAKAPEEQAVADTGTIAAGEVSKLKQNNGLEAKAEDTSSAEQAEIAPTASIATTSLPPVLDIVPVNLAAATRTFAQPLHVGDLRLADLRKLLGAAGHRAEFRGEGTLVVDGIVAVRKSAGGRIEIEGSEGMRNIGYPPGQQTFGRVKRKIYEGLAVISGG